MFLHLGNAWRWLLGLVVNDDVEFPGSGRHANMLGIFSRGPVPLYPAFMSSLIGCTWTPPSALMGNWCPPSSESQKIRPLPATHFSYPSQYSCFYSLYLDSWFVKITQPIMVCICVCVFACLLIYEDMHDYIHAYTHFQPSFYSHSTSSINVWEMITYLMNPSLRSTDWRSSWKRWE